MENSKDGKGISVNITEENDCRKVISIEVSPEILGGEKQRILGKLMRDVTIPGFRKGKAPASAVESRYADHIHSETMKSVLPMAYGHALEKENIRPIGEPVFRDINVGENDPLTFKVDVETAPVIELEEYKGLAGKKKKVKVEKEDIEKVLENLRERQVDFVSVEREAGKEDVVILDYVPIGEGGEPEEDKRMKDYPVQLGAGQLFPEFEEAVAGKKAGDEGSARIEYPEDFKPERLAGLKVEYAFTVKEVKERKLPELDDDFASSLDEKFKTIADLRDDISRRLLDEKEREATRKLEEEVIDRIIDKNPFDIPRSMIERFKKELEAEDQRRRAMAGVGPEEDEEKKKEIDEVFDRISRRNIKRYFLIDHIAGLEKIEIGDEEMDREIERLAEEGGKPPEEVRKIVHKGSENYDNLRNRLRERKVFEVLLG